MEKYKISIGIFAKPAIEKVDVERETQHSLWINGRRHKKYTDSSCYMNTWDEAHKKLMDYATQKVSLANHRLNQAKSLLDNVKSLS